MLVCNVYDVCDVCDVSNVCDTSIATSREEDNGHIKLSYYSLIINPFGAHQILLCILYK